jgi:hypothetical protein
LARKTGRIEDGFLIGGRGAHFKEHCALYYWENVYVGYRVMSWAFGMVG